MTLTLLLSAGLAQAQDVDFVQIAERDGLPTALEQLQGLVAASKNPKKLEKALAGTRLSEVSLPGKAAFGAELELTSVGALTGCRWDAGLACTLTAGSSAPVKGGDFQVFCKSKYGATADISATLDQASDTEVRWTVRQVENCWSLNGAQVTILPTAHDDLEGIGTGDDDMIAPELAGLRWEQVEKTIISNMGSFKACTKLNEGDPATGKLVVAFHIGEDGKLDKVEPEMSALDSPEAEACILERFKRISFPPPNDGFTDGTFPFTFQ